MFNPFEYVGRIKRRIKQSLIEAGQEVELRKYLENPYNYKENLFNVAIGEYNPYSDTCRNCRDYLVCDNISNGLETRKLEIYTDYIEVEQIITRPLRFNMN